MHSEDFEYFFCSFIKQDKGNNYLEYIFSDGVSFVLIENEFCLVDTNKVMNNVST